jgi:hypothetical protein
MARTPTLGGRAVSDDELARIRREIESYDAVGDVDDDLRRLIEDHMPDLVAKLPPPPKPRQRGCLQMLAAGLGGLMLLPGFCSILLMGNFEFRANPSDVYTTLAVGAVGVALIYWAFRRRR